MRIATGIGDRVRRGRNMHRWLYAVDVMGARYVDALQPKAVVAYENAALHVFLRAKRTGSMCILDAASIHYSRGNELLTSDDVEFRERIDRRKQREIELADAIICCSEMAAASYVEAGIDPGKVFTLPLGAALPARYDIEEEPGSEGPLRVIFAGAMQARKGIDLVFSAIEELWLESPGSVELTICGGSDSPEWVNRALSARGVTYLGPVSQERLFGELARSHALLLPSRFDSFGMVVAESLAVGTPAVVSENTGAKMIIERFPRSGWIVSAERDSVLKQLRWMLKNRAEISASRKYAKIAADHYTWESYRQGVGKLFSQFPFWPATL